MNEKQVENALTVMKGKAVPKAIKAQQKDLSSMLKSREKSFIKKLEKYKIAKAEPDEIDFGDKKLSTLELTEYAFSPIIDNYGQISTYYDEVKLNEVFIVFRQIVSEINKVELFIPTLFHFCNFVGVSEWYFKKTWLENGTPEIHEVCQRIMDYLSQRNADGYLYGKTNAVAGIYIDKSRYGKMDNVAPVQNNIFISNTTVESEEVERMKKKYGIE